VVYYFVIKLAYNII